MFSIWTLLTLAHLIGLALGVGAATVKLFLLIKCNSDFALVPFFLKVVRMITRLIISGLVLLTLSGIGWIILGTTFTTVLIVKLGLVLLIWMIGPYIDNVIEPRYKELAPLSGENPSAEFVLIQKKYLRVETLATSLFYVITLLGVLI